MRLVNRKRSILKTKPPRARNLQARTRATSLVLALVFYATASAAVESGVFQPPALDQFIPSDKSDADGDGDGVEETQVQRYRNLDGDRAFSLTTNGRLWAWSVDTERSEAGNADYVIRDSDCDGSFDERYGLDEEFHLPDCAK